jgi:hypothetical protein
MNRINEEDGLFDAHRVKQVLVFVDEGLLVGVVEPARHGLRLAIVKAQAMQQRDQPERLCSVQMSASAKPRSSGCCAGAMGVDPIAQSDCLLVGEAAAGAFVAKALQPLDAISLIGPTPIANRVIVEQQCRRDPLAAPAPIEKHDSIGSAGHAMLRKSTPSKPS